MYVPGVKTLERVSRPIRTLFAPGALILGYHRIADDAWDPLGLCIKRRHFDEQLALLKRFFTPVSMTAMLSAAREGRRIAGLVAVTFDDGYRDFIENALPALNDAGVPATVFVTTGNAGRPFWWDEVSNLVGAGPSSRGRLELRWRSSSQRYSIDAGASTEQLARSAQFLCRELASADDADRKAVIDQLRTWSRSPAGRQRVPSAMSASDIQNLAVIEGIDIGSHTVSHPRLADLPVEFQRTEIDNSRRYLEALVGVGRLSGISYPNGSFNELTISLVRRAGFIYACTSHQNVVSNSTHPFLLPRIWAPNVGGEGFRRWLSSWYGLRI